MFHLTNGGLDYETEKENALSGGVRARQLPERRQRSLLRRIKQRLNMVQLNADHLRAYPRPSQTLRGAFLFSIETMRAKSEQQ